MDSWKPENVPTIVRVLCAYRGLSVSELAGSVGYSTQVMSNRMTGRVEFGLKDILAISEHLKVDMDVWADAPENALHHLRDTPQSTSTDDRDPGFRTGSSSTPSLGTDDGPFWGRRSSDRGTDLDTVDLNESEIQRSHAAA